MANSVFVSLSHVSHQFDNGLQLWTDLNATFNAHLQALVGINGIGKSTLGKILARLISPTAGQVAGSERCCYLPQKYPGAPQDRLATVFAVEHFCLAQQRLEQGIANSGDYALLEQDWHWRNRLIQLAEQLQLSFNWQLDDRWQQFSGGQQSQLLLLAAVYQQPEFLILDEPSNHLDQQQKQHLLDWLQADDSMCKLVISHDRFLLQHMDIFYELSRDQLYKHVGGFAAYLANKHQRQHNQQLQLQQADRQLRHQKKALQSSVEKTQQRAASGKYKALRRDSSKMETDFNIESGSKGRSTQLHRHRQQLADARQQRQQHYQALEWREDIHIELPASEVASHKLIVSCNNLVYGLADFRSQPLNLEIRGPQHLHLQGSNGSGKSTLLATLLGKLSPRSGSYCVHVRCACLDQHLSVLDGQLSSWDNFRNMHPQASPSEAGEALARVGLRAARNEVKVSLLSGSEQLRAAIAIVLMGPDTPQLLLLDEPSNHLDMETADILINAINHFHGAIILASHDAYFCAGIRMTGSLQISQVIS